MDSKKFNIIAANLILIILLTFFLLAVFIPGPKIHNGNLQPVEQKNSSKIIQQINDSNSKLGNITGQEDIVNTTKTNVTETKISELDGPYKIMGISSVEDKLNSDKIELLWSQLNIEGKEHPNSFTIGYLLNISGDLEEFFINGSCKTEKNEMYKFRGKLYSRDIFGDMNPKHKGSVIYLTTQNPDLAKIRFAVLRPKTTGSKESIQNHGFQYKDVEQNSTYIVSFGFHSFDSIKEDKEMTCTLELNSSKRKINKSFDFHYINDR